MAWALMPMRPPSRALTRLEAAPLLAEERIHRERQFSKVSGTVLLPRRPHLVLGFAGRHSGVPPTRRRSVRQGPQGFDKPIADLQAIQFMLADMATEIDAARLLIWKAACLKDAGVRHSPESAMAKLYASEMSNRVTTRRCRSTAATATSEFDADAIRAMRASPNLRGHERDPATRHRREPAAGLRANQMDLQPTEAQTQIRELARRFAASVWPDRPPARRESLYPPPS